MSRDIYSFDPCCSVKNWKIERDLDKCHADVNAALECLQVLFPLIHSVCSLTPYFVAVKQPNEYVQAATAIHRHDASTSNVNGGGATTAFDIPSRRGVTTTFDIPS